jgi:hypothetical protein
MIFSAPMARALLAGRKTMTRRIVKPQPDKTIDGQPYWDIGGFRTYPDAANPLRCPFGSHGDTLYVREAYRTLAMWDSLPMRGIPNPGNIPLKYEADGTINAPTPYPYGKLRPSIFLPRWASRITLEITGVRVERLNNISEVDAKSEGIKVLPLQSYDDSSAWYQSAPGVHQDRTARGSFIQLWESLHGADSWDANSWLWVISFRRIKP